MSDYRPISGESGTGKEVFARAIHAYSERPDKPFIPFNCTAVPREMLESQLFGYRRGAFTGADRDNPGLIRSARDGTLFLDEIPALVNHFVGQAAEEFRKGHVRLTEEAMEQLLLYDWPGNIRQLNNELRRMIALAEADSVLGVADLTKEIVAQTAAQSRRPAPGELAVPLHDKLTPTLSKIEFAMIKAALREHHGRVDQAAKALGISRKGLYLKRQRLGL